MPAVRLHVHQCRGPYREWFLITLGFTHRAQVHRVRVLDEIGLPLVVELWREQHPGVPEQLPLCLSPFAEAASGQAWLWKTLRVV
jgi:hypothetical protein